MELDKTTFYDLSIFNREEEFSLFHRLDFTTTAGGREYLRQLFSTPLPDIAAIEQRQQTLKYILEKEAQWPEIISNGTIVVVENYLEAQIAPISSTSGPGLLLNAVITKTIYAPDYGFIKFSFTQLLNLVKGFRSLVQTFNTDQTPKILKQILDRAQQLLHQREFSELLQITDPEKLSFVQILRHDHFIRNRQKKQLWELLDLYKKLDAYYAMAKAMRQFKLQFPVFEDTAHPFIAAKQLYHMILPQPVSYDIELDPQARFLFLTGANMAGKTTFIKAVGVAVFLAHIGMGVPAQAMKLSFFHGIFSNIQVQDNIFKGESYFYSEVQRIKNTIIKISNGKHWLVLIDEMFKGTNVEDAKNCSLAVIQGLVRSTNCLFILSTHLYELAEDLQEEPHLRFKYFESEVIDDNLHFTYQLKDGIAKEKIGYLILKREKVLDLLKEIK
ncbi:DNA mismatch repair protein MutS [Chitinophaga agrisoli]|uniref:DNA mismatch repair protein MutS n=1 Tax=Chitinophaga agrisoli TaxID=2607653 RepID=A0A5B2VNN5_9BACT|nr:DNA mismatch repair protein MutS [Chitinophaga agrisoli]KAA2240655.1 DNA mismatch repair protein MutS [Chitinophaga agrisoli]